MARLIDADSLEAKLEEQRKLYIDMDMKGAEHLLVHDVLHHVWEAPTIDAVPVVRCKDCKFYGTPKNFKKPYCMRGAYVKVNADDYCSKGERR